MARGARRSVLPQIRPHTPAQGVSPITGPKGRSLGKPPKRFLRFGVAGSIERGVRANVKFAKLATAPPIIPKMERKLTRVVKRTGKAEARDSKLQGKLALAETNRINATNWLWGTRWIGKSFWGWRVRRLNVKLATNAQMITALDKAAEAVANEYNQRLGLKGLKQQVRLQRAQAEMRNQMPQIQRRFRKIVGDLGQTYSFFLQQIRRDTALPRALTNVQRVRTPEQVIEFETYLRMVQRALEQNNAAEATQYIDMMTRMFGPSPAAPTPARSRASRGARARPRRRP